MRDSTLTRTEGDGSISVCAEVTSPTGELGISVDVRFTRSGQSPGIKKNNKLVATYSQIVAC